MTHNAYIERSLVMQLWRAVSYSVYITQERKNYWTNALEKGEGLRWRAASLFATELPTRVHDRLASMVSGPGSQQNAVGGARMRRVKYGRHSRLLLLLLLIMMMLWATGVCVFVLRKWRAGHMYRLQMPARSTWHMFSRSLIRACCTVYHLRHIYLHTSQYKVS